MPVAVQTRQSQPALKIPDGDTPYRIGFKRPDGFSMTDPEINARRGVILGHSYDFEVKLGKLKVDDKQYGRTYLLEVDVDRISATVNSRLPLGGFGSHSHVDVIDTTSQVVADVLNEKGLRVCSYISGWPTMIMIVDGIPSKGSA